MIDLRGDLGRIHGSVGVTIDRPNIVLKARPSAELEVKGSRADRARALAEVILSSSGVEGGAEIEIVEDIPEHSGFGSGTQLALAVGTALSVLYNLGLTTEEIAVRLKRSRRSGVGTYAFKLGGFIVDGGHSVDKMDVLPPLLFRSEVPEGWRFVVGVPRLGKDHSGAVEEEAFRRLGPPPESLLGEISRVILFKMMPAVLERDAATFGSAMTALDFKFGEFWKEVQGGLFSDPAIEEGINFLLEAGAHGVGQSSWGPAFYGLVEGAGQAEELSVRLAEFLNRERHGDESFVARPDNTGAVITIDEG